MLEVRSHRLQHLTKRSLGSQKKKQNPAQCPKSLPARRIHTQKFGLKMRSRGVKLPEGGTSLLPHLSSQFSAGGKRNGSTNLLTSVLTNQWFTSVLNVEPKKPLESNLPQVCSEQPTTTSSTYAYCAKLDDRNSACGIACVRTGTGNRSENIPGISGTLKPTIGALIIRIGFWGPVYYT